ncbi:hypothetical protein COCCADRAFT_111420 [Bipolaris zeicola 26-R-13]|uniref:Uncharacterized protein n=1 Tax=Cochliobolus carbonum (strain 26-R-13) TaxID=930089 RepID=W6Y8Y9_COCC2|nr:uncharacterized protein COCCADRAFT_111420 [Bipolaris zeicola 26-R-13]EUC27546.1 hypothetical protein COCCADRAFT_111420 [Bipolaris zeicola 26-R-13]
MKIGGKISPKVPASSPKSVHQKQFQGPVLIGVVSIILIIVIGFLIFWLCKSAKKMKGYLIKVRSQRESNV